MKNQMTVRSITIIALMAAVMCILGPFSIPIGPVPISFTNLVIYIAVILLGCKNGTISYIIYLLIGLVGLPVFSGFAGGVGKVLGPTGGYLIGFVFMALISGLFVSKFQGKKVMYAVGMILGTAVAYLFGTVWLAYQAKLTFMAALAAGVIPFIIGDIIKIVIAIFLGETIRKRMK